MNTPADRVRLTESQKWDHSIEKAVRKASYGLLAGMVGHVFFRKHKRLTGLAYGLCIGIGLGQAYTEAAYLFEHDVTFDRRLVAHVVADKLQS
eukprot:TRINITY_DN57943_c0_g1_i1.p2 TRINITY_DN57943_c0_g1~~TRINITY_DN57943_c0_g1_i1.p2  ORF type:complete len:108 (-),score=24.32 TRINITY_DN57943_c0_g1_i1:128-406(-)